jgi:succinate dehydrogenase hydrophobic anchor subunit
MNTTNPRPIAHWLSQRSTAILILFTLLLASFSFFLFALSIFVFWHLYLGLEEILADYVHNEIIGNLFLKLLQIFLLVNLKYFIVFFII